MRQHIMRWELRPSGFYAAYTGNSYPLPLKIGPIGCSETSVRITTAA